jgi:ribonuclease BN (tRNA processing enzyme)
MSSFLRSHQPIAWAWVPLTAVLLSGALYDGSAAGWTRAGGAVLLAALLHRMYVGNEYVKRGDPALAWLAARGGHERVEQPGVVIGGDGVPCASLDELCRGADGYVQTVLRDDLVRMVPNARFQDILDYHSTVADAARTAARAGVRTLVLTHYVPSLQPGQEDLWRALATEHFAGSVVLGDDLTTVEL